MAPGEERLPFVGRAIYPFHSHIEGELSLAAGDLVLVIRTEDRYWYYGQMGDRLCGRFPRSNIGNSAVDLPAAESHQSYFITVAPFTPQQKGDLAFYKNEILVGLNCIDANWWNGRTADGRQGIFPTSLAWQIPVDLLSPVQNVITSKSLAFVRRRARVLQDLVAQLPEELDLKKESIVIVTGDAEDGWYHGELPDGSKSGIFPRGFVSLLDQDTEPVASLVQVFPEPVVQQQQNGKRPYGTAVYDFNGQQDDELSFREGQVIELLRRVNDEWMEGQVNERRGIFPTAFLNIVVDLPTHPPAVVESVDQLLMDFDPFGCSTVVYPISTSPAPIKKTVDLDSVIARNLNQLGSLTNSSACSKQRPASWTESLAQIQLEYSTKTPIVPPRRHEIQSHVPAPTPITRSISPAPIVVRPPPLPPPPTFSKPPSTRIAHSEIADVIRTENSSGHASNGDEPASEHVAGDSAASSRKSYTRPAPPPPPKFVPKTTTTVSQARTLTRSLSLQPAPPVPSFDLSGATTSMNSNVEANDASSSIPIDATMTSTSTTGGASRQLVGRQASYKLATGSEDARVEGRRKRVEKDKHRKMEEDLLRDLEMKKKVKEQRENVLTELLVTEREYCRDLRLTCQVFQLDDVEALERKGIDATVLFGNILEVIRLSESFIDQLNKCTVEGANEEQSSIGNCFIRNEPEFRRIYGQYCTNHDDAQNLLERYESLPSVTRVLEQGIQTLRQQIVCFNFGSVIIKPVQRIMKYPLILSELIKCTENDHPDKSKLMLAAGLMTSVATYINESKRKKEIVLKYREVAEEPLSRRISRFNMHSVAKKSSRLGMLLKTSLGMATATRDEVFEETEGRFSELVRVIQTALRDITTVCEQLKQTSQTQFNISESVASFYGENSRVPLIDNFRTAQRMIFTQHWSSFDAYVIQHVRNPLASLCEACLGPERLVQKRRDKLLDANIASEKLAKNKDASMRRTLEEQEQLARNTYSALNSQLLEELPVITEHGYNIYRRCLSSFLHARKLLVGRITKALLDLNEMPDISNLQGEIDEDFNAAYGRAVDRLLRVTFINSSFRLSVRSSLSSVEGTISPTEITPPRKPSTAPMGNQSPGEGLVVQSRETVNALRAKYHPDQLYMVTGRCDIKDPLDLAANSGLIVSVIKREDPMGNSARWFVDCGEVRGFLPAKYLSLVPANTGGNRLLRPESAASASSSGASVSVNSNSLDSFRDASLIDEETAAAVALPENHYDLPPSYEEAQSFPTPHRYYEIETSPSKHDDSIASEDLPTYNSPNKAESPIYADIDEILEKPKQPPPPPPTISFNNVFKVDFAFERRTPLEISLMDGELVTVLEKQDEAGNNEWWLVENDAGLRGYAPAAYLSELATDD